jgi:hypothetical protein
LPKFILSWSFCGWQAMFIMGLSGRQSYLSHVCLQVKTGQHHRGQVEWHKGKIPMLILGLRL